jgi:hypothetical protein
MAKLIEEGAEEERHSVSLEFNSSPMRRRRAGRDTSGNAFEVA